MLKVLISAFALISYYKYSKIIYFIYGINYIIQIKNIIAVIENMYIVPVTFQILL